MKFEPIEVIDNPFYFGIGGVGDFLLLMATFYDKIKSNTDVIFVCNNVNTIREVTKQFPKINRTWIFPMNAFEKSPEMWKSIVKNKLCMGTGVTPCEFRYVEDWIECGKHDVFRYYGVKKNPDWASPIETDENIICIQPFGGADDKTKKKEIPMDEVMRIIDENCYSHDIILMGSEKDKEKFKGVVSENWWVINFKDSFDTIRKCSKFISADTWGKTLAGLSGKDVTIYPNQYPISIESIFNHPVDPSDYVFLRNWGFKYADGRSV